MPLGALPDVLFDMTTDPRAPASVLRGHFNCECILRQEAPRAEEPLQLALRSDTLVVCEYKAFMPDNQAELYRTLPCPSELVVQDVARHRQVDGKETFLTALVERTEDECWLDAVPVHDALKDTIPFDLLLMELSSHCWVEHDAPHKIVLDLPLG